MYTTIIADDEKLICDAILSVLHAAVPELDDIHVFYNGADTYDYVQSHKADILLLDIEMPEKSGLDIAQYISEQDYDCYVIIITAYRDFDYAKRAIDCQVDAFLTKPFSSQELVDTVRKGLASFQKEAKPKPFVKSQSNNYIVSSAMNYIQNNFTSSTLSLDNVADALSVSCGHLSRLFKKHTGQNFPEYLLKVRMEHAKMLLETTNMSTTDIATATGYESSVYFRQSFKSCFNMTPRQYREITCDHQLTHGKENNEL